MKSIKYNYEDFASKNKKNNTILANNIYLDLDTSHTKRNNNVLVIGQPGSGKTEYIVKPNLEQKNSSYIVLDNSKLYETYAENFKKSGYNVKIIDFNDTKRSNYYNPFEYIRDDLDVLVFVNCIIRNTNKWESSDPFWEKSETALLQAIVFYLIKHRPKEEQNFEFVMKLLRAAEVDESDPDKKSPLDRIFDEVQKKDPGSLALRQYQTFKMGAGKTLKSIVISCTNRLTMFDLKEIKNITNKDNIALDKIDEGKQIVFVVPNRNESNNFLIAMLYTQIFKQLYNNAEYKYIPHCLPYHVRFIFDDIGSVGKIADFGTKLATMRKYNINCMIVSQDLNTIKNIYNQNDEYESIIGNCDSIVLTKSGNNVCKDFAKIIKILPEDELEELEYEKCFVFIKGIKPIKAFKYNVK